MSGLMFVQFVRTLAGQDAPPLNVYFTEESLYWAIKMCSANYLNVAESDRQCAKNSDGREVMRWTVVQPGQQVKLRPATTAYGFPADHFSGALG